MSHPAPKLVVLGLQQSFLQMVHNQMTALFGHKIKVRTLALNDLETQPPKPDETILYFNRGLRTMVETMVSATCNFVLAQREPLVFNMQELFSLDTPCRILVVNDIKSNTDEMTRDLVCLNLPHTFVPYYPDSDLTEDIDYVVTAGERMLVPHTLKHCPVIDIGLRFISLKTVFELFEHFGIGFDHADLARHYMRTMMVISEKWPALDKDRFKTVSRLGQPSGARAIFRLDDLTANSPAMAELCRDLALMAATHRPIHIVGRPGTGKSIICQGLHNASALDQGPFVSINCAARSKDSLEKELFGWEARDRSFKGLFEEAAHGTLCIEEVGQLPKALQARLLQALSEGLIIRTFGQSHVPVTARIITTSSKSMEELKAMGFNRELILAMTAHVCRLPTLSERMQDFETLISEYLNRDLNRPDVVLPADTLAILKAHDWEGNVQELFNVIQHMVCTARGNILHKTFLPYYINQSIQGTTAVASPAQLDPSVLKAQMTSIAQEITRHGFLSESRAILSVYHAGKEQNKALGRTAVLAQLQKNGYALSVQQLRLRLERMNSLGLLIVRPGRGGTTLSDRGDAFHDFLSGL